MLVLSQRSQYATPAQVLHPLSKTQRSLLLGISKCTRRTHWVHFPPRYREITAQQLYAGHGPRHCRSFYGHKFELGSQLWLAKCHFHCCRAAD